MISKLKQELARKVSRYKQSDVYSENPKVVKRIARQLKAIEELEFKIAQQSSITKFECEMGCPDCTSRGYCNGDC